MLLSYVWGSSCIVWKSSENKTNQLEPEKGEIFYSSMNVNMNDLFVVLCLNAQALKDKLCIT